MISPTGTKKIRIKKQAGFTLIELILVILLLSVITAISSPLFKKTFTNLQLRNAALNIAQTAGYAREMAIIERVNYKLKIDPKNKTFWITKLIYSPDKPEYQRIGGKQGKKFFLPRDVKIDSGKKEIIFYPDGRSDKAEIKVTDKSQKGYLILIKGFGSQIPVEAIE